MTRMVSKAHKVMPESITDMTSVSTGTAPYIYLFIVYYTTILYNYPTITKGETLDD